MEQSRKLTAVEYLGFQINLNPTTIHKNENTNDWTITIKINELNEIYKQAKELEKERIIDFYKWMKNNDTEQNAEQYFHYTDEDMLNEYLKTKK